MKTKLFYLLMLIFSVSSSAIFAQGFQPPSNGKAVIYFVSLKKKTITFEYFHQDKYIGVFGKKNYMRYECDPGKQLFWVSSETKDFVIADLQAGGTYIVIVEMKIGWWRANPDLMAIKVNHEFFANAAALIKSKPPVVTPNEKIELRNFELTDFVANILDIYETEWKETRDYTHITPDMAIPEEAMK
jgi:hypothetical protein